MSDDTGPSDPARAREALRIAERALQESEAFNRAIVDSIPQNVFLKDRRSVYLAVNKSYAASLGCRPEEVVGKDDFAFFPTALAERYRADDQAVIESGVSRKFQERYVAQGHEYWIRTTKAPVKDSSGKVTAILGLFEDVTESKRAVDALEASERRYRRLFESAKDGILILDASTGCIVDANPFLENLAGYTHAELVGKELWEIGPFRDIAASRTAFSRLQTESYIRYEDLPLRARDGRTIDVEFVSNVYRVGDQDVVQCNIRDISARKRAEAERDRLATAIEQAAEMVLVTDAQGDIVYANPAFEAVTGYARAEVLGKNPRLLKSGAQDAEFYRAMWATISAGKTWHGRVVNKKKDGTLYTQESAISPVRNATGSIVSYVTVNRDITRDLTLEAQLFESRKLESIGRLAGAVAHDFNNIVSVIVSYAGFALDQLRPGDPLRDDLLEVTKASERAAALTRQLLAFGRKQVLQPVVLDLNRVIEGMDGMLRRLAGEGIELVWAPAPDLGLVEADPAQIDQILMNLVINARDAMPDGGRLTVETANAELDEDYVALHPAVDAGRFVMLSVTDTGCGMDDETRSRIFEPFFTTKEPGKGTGLGLSTVYGIVKQSGGTIWVYSEPGRGATFKLYLPRTDADATPRPARRSTPLALGGTETILVVEDEDALLRVAKRGLRAAGYTVLTAADGDAAIKVSLEHPDTIHLLVTDMMMPRMGGKALATALSTTRPGLKVLYMSGYADDGLVAQGVLDPGAHFLRKPFAAPELARKVREVLDEPPAP